MKFEYSILKTKIQLNLQIKYEYELNVFFMYKHKNQQLIVIKSQTLNEQFNYRFFYM